MNKVEILAPAGSKESASAAVRCGADAIYLGGPLFNARQNAQNFDMGALGETVAYCHQRGVKVHLTLNTLVFDREFQELIPFIEQVAALGVDAFIVQDFGVFSALRQIAPHIPIHASTQMSIHSPAGARLLQEMGATRVVLAREMTREEIKAVTAIPDLETEVFIHGALCMCVSGQCYLSAVMGGRSGNRGRCAGPCRLPFSSRAPGRYDLSLKDLSLIPRLSELADLGVTSLKIEGRMKRPEYVAAAVSACKGALAGTPCYEEELAAVFSRSGFTTGYFDDKMGPDMFGTRQKEDVEAAASVLGSLRALYKSETPLVPLHGSFTLKREGAALTLEDDRGNRATANGPAPEAALHRATDREQVEKAMGKLGGTPFFLSALSCQVEPGLMLPASALNAMRREVVDALLAQRGKAPEAPLGQYRPAPHVPGRGPVALWGRFRRFDQISPYSMANLEKISLPLEEVAAHWEALLPVADKLLLEAPRMVFGREGRATAQLEALQEKGFYQLLAGNAWAVQAGRELSLHITGGPGLNVVNSEAIAAYQRLGLEGLTASFETPLSALTKLSCPIPVGFIGYGHLPLMVTRNCPIHNQYTCKECGGRKQLTDRKGVAFPVTCDGHVSELLNPKCLYLADRLGEFQNMAFCTLYFTTETKNVCENVVKAYQSGKAPEGTEYTRGLYYSPIL